MLIENHIFLSSNPELWSHFTTTIYGDLSGRRSNKYAKEYWYKQNQGWFQGAPSNGTPENGKRDPYYSHIFRGFEHGSGWYGNSMGPLLTSFGGPMSLGVPENPDKNPTHHSTLKEYLDFPGWDAHIQWTPVTFAYTPYQPASFT